MRVIQEFKTFALKGNVVDLAVGVIIGAAFGKIVGALVDQVLMPPLGLLIGGVDFSQLKIVLKTNPEVAIGYGVLLQSTLNFLIVAWALFVVIRLMNRLNSQRTSAPTATPTAPPEDILLLREIRDALKSEKFAK